MANPITLEAMQVMYARIRCHSILLSLGAFPAHTVNMTAGSPVGKKQSIDMTDQNTKSKISFSFMIGGFGPHDKSL